MPEQTWRNLPAGPELDSLIAERVLGWEPYWGHQGEYIGAKRPVTNGWRREDFRPSTTWAGMGLVVEAMEARGYRFDLGSHPWHAAFLSPSFEWERDPREKADTAPLAICRAALTALEGARGVD